MADKSESRGGTDWRQYHLNKQKGDKMNKLIQTEIDDITSILNHVESFTSCPHVKDAVPLLKIKYNRVKEYINDSHNREIFGKDY